MRHGNRTTFVNFRCKNLALTKQKLVRRSLCYVLWDRKLTKKTKSQDFTYIFTTTFFESDTNVMKKKGIDILRLTLQHHNKFLKERENKQLLQAQIIGPDGMNGHHQWSTTDRITSSQQQISHGVVMQGKKSNTCMSLLTDLLSFVLWNCSAVVTNSSKSCSLLIRYCWTYIVLWWHHNICWFDWHLWFIVHGTLVLDYHHLP